MPLEVALVCLFSVFLLFEEFVFIVCMKFYFRRKGIFANSIGTTLPTIK